MQEERTSKINILLGIGLTLIAVSTMWLILTIILTQDKSAPALGTNTTNATTATTPEPGDETVKKFREDTFFGAPSVLALGVFLATCGLAVKISHKRQQQAAARDAQTRTAELTGVPTAEVAEVPTATQVGRANHELSFLEFARPSIERASQLPQF